MKKFKFNLNSYLRLKKHLEKLAQQEVASVIFKIRESKKRVESLKTNYYKRAKQLDHETVSGIYANRYNIFKTDMAGIKSSMEEEKLRCLDLLKVLEEKKKELAKKSVDKKILENLKGRRKEEYYINMEKLLQKEADDMLIVRKAGDINQ